MAICTRLQEHSRQALAAELSLILSHLCGASQSPQTPRARGGTSPQGWAQPQAGWARRNRSYKPRQVGSLTSRCSSHHRVRPGLKVTSQAAPNTIKPLRPVLSCAGAPRAQGTQLWARLQQLSFHLSSFSPVSTELPRTRAHFPSACLRQSFLLERDTISQSFPTFLPRGKKRGLGHVGHQRQVQSFNLVPMPSRHPPARGAHACLCSGRQGRSCRAYSKCRRRRLPGNNRNKEGAIFELATYVLMEIKLTLTRGRQAVLRERRHRALLDTSRKSLPCRKLFALPKGHCSKRRASWDLGTAGQPAHQQPGWRPSQCHRSRVQARGPAPATSPRLALGSVWVRALHSILRQRWCRSQPQLLREQTITVGQPRGAGVKEITANVPGAAKVWEWAGSGRHRAVASKQSFAQQGGRWEEGRATPRDGIYSPPTNQAALPWAPGRAGSR